jgi:S-adenosylmethionine hydrolase
VSGIITLTTDFSTADAYVGAIKGVILSIAPEATIVDLAHDIGPHDVDQAAFVLETAYKYFPEGAIHMVVVDPGVGSVRRRLAMRCGKYYFVGPDNGVFAYPIKACGLCECVELAASASAGKLRGVTFEGRDVFAPAAARLALGVPLQELGPEAHNPMQLDLAHPKITSTSIEGRIIHVDHFGNCISNIITADIEKLGENVMVSVGGYEVGGLMMSYSDVPVGDMLAIINSLDHLEIATNQGNAADELNITVGTPVRVVLI